MQLFYGQNAEIWSLYSVNKPKYTMYSESEKQMCLICPSQMFGACEGQGCEWLMAQAFGHLWRWQGALLGPDTQEGGFEQVVAKPLVSKRQRGEHLLPEALGFEPDKGNG